MSELSTSNRALLRLIAEHGPVTTPDCAHLDGIDDILDALPAQNLRSRLLELLREGLIKSSGHYRGTHAAYSLTAAGHRTLHSAARATGSMALPRTAYAQDRYIGAELMPYGGRPGAMDAFAIPSLTNGIAHPRVRPHLISSLPDRQP